MANIRELRAIFTAQTKGMTKAIRDVRTEVSQLGPDAQRAAQSASNSYGNVGNAAQGAAGDIQDLGQAGSNALNNVDTAADSAAGNLGDVETAAQRAARELGELGGDNGLNDVTQDADRASDNLGDVEDAAERARRELGDLGGDNGLDDLTRDADRAGDNLDDLENNIDDVDDALNDAEDGVHDFGDAAESETRNAEGSFGKLKKALGGIAIAIAGAFAIDKIKDFAWNLAETAGSAQAMKAQFAAVFEGMETEAADRLGAIASEAGILENRMKESFTKIAAFAKTGGMDTADSLDLADRSMRAVADSAAFYDKSLEDTTESLQSFLKGNFENDAALGLSATETTRNAAANDLYGKSFIELSESQKQLTLLQMVEDANKVAGALGQAARESDGWENVVGNMKQSWTDFKAVIGEPVLEVMVKGLKGVTAAFKNIDAESVRDKIAGAFAVIGNVIGPIKDKVEDVIIAFGALKAFLSGEESGADVLMSYGIDPDKFQDVIMFAELIRKAIGKVWKSFQDGKVYVDAVFALFKNQDGTAISLLHKLGLKPEEIQPIMDAVHDIQARFEEFGDRIDKALYPFKETIKGIFALFMNMDGTAISIFHQLGLSPEEIQKIMDAVDDVKQRFSDFFTNIVTLAKLHLGNVAQYWSIILDAAVKVFNMLMPYIRPALDAVFTFISGIVKKISDFWKSDGEQLMLAVGNLFKGILAVIKFIMPLVLGIIKMVWTNIKGVISGALNVIMGLVKVFSGLFTGDFSKMWEGLKQIFFGAIQFIWNFVQLTFFGKLLSGVKAFALTFRAFFASLWTGIVSLFKGNAGAAIGIIRTAWTTIYNSTKATLTSVWHFIRDIFLFIKNVIVGAVSLYFKILRGGWTAIFNVTRTIFTSVFNFFKSIFTSIRNFISGSATSILTNMRNTWNALKTNTTGAFRDIFNAIKTKFTDIVNLAKGLPQRIGDGIGSMASKVTAGVTKVINKLASTLGKGVNGVIGGINWVLDKIGVNSEIPLWKVPQYAQGTGKGGHPGGLALVNDGKGNNAGPELIKTPDGKVGTLPGKNVVTNLPKGTEVLSAKNTKEYLKTLPAYAWGTDVWNGVKKVGGKIGSGIKSVGSKVKDIAVDAFDYIKNPSGLLSLGLKALGVKRPDETGFIGNMAKGAYDKVKKGAVALAKKSLDSFAASAGGAASFGGAFRKTSSYGWRTHPITGRRTFHNGDDYGAAAGTNIPNQAAGIVKRAGYEVSRGNTVRVLSGIFERVYQHNARNFVKKGQTVGKGHILGTVGSTGDSTGPHLHYEVLKNGSPINPGSLKGVSLGKAGKGGQGGQEVSAASKYLSAIIGDGDWMNDWVTHLPKHLVSGALGYGKKAASYMSSYGRPARNYFEAIAEDGDWLNDWATHVPKAVKNPLLTVGKYLSNLQKYANGGIVDEAQLAWIAEGGWAESIISHDPAKRTSQKAIWEQTGKELGFDMSNPKMLEYLERIANATESGHSHPIVINGREAAKALNPDLQKLQKSNDKIKEIYG